MIEILLESPLAASTSRLIAVGDTSYRFDIAWNERDECWYISVSTEDGTPIYCQRPIVVTTFFLEPKEEAPWIFLANDSSGQDCDPGREDLGQRVKLVIIEGSDLEGIDTTAASGKNLLIEA